MPSERFQKMSELLANAKKLRDFRQAPTEATNEQANVPSIQQMIQNFVTLYTMPQTEAETDAITNANAEGNLSAANDVNIEDYIDIGKMARQIMELLRQTATTADEHFVIYNTCINSGEFNLENSPNTHAEHIRACLYENPEPFYVRELAGKILSGKVTVSDEFLQSAVRTAFTCLIYAESAQANATGELTSTEAQLLKTAVDRTRKRIPGFKAGESLATMSQKRYSQLVQDTVENLQKIRIEFPQHVKIKNEHCPLLDEVSRFVSLALQRNAALDANLSPSSSSGAIDSLATSPFSSPQRRDQVGKPEDEGMPKTEYTITFVEDEREDSDNDASVKFDSEGEEAEYDSESEEAEYDLEGEEAEYDLEGEEAEYDSESEEAESDVDSEASVDPQPSSPRKFRR